jgi:hypothetical protein
MSQRDRNFRSPSPSRRGLARCVRDMALLWLGLGAVVGAASTPPGGGVIGVVAFVIAGMIVLPVLGAALGLFGGRVTDTLIGAGFGGAVGALAALTLSAANPLFLVNLGLINGGIVAATFGGMIRLAQRLAEGQLMARAGR